MDYRHQAATGGPIGMLVEAGKSIPFQSGDVVAPFKVVAG